MQNKPWRWYLIVLILAYSTLWSIPSFMSETPKWWSRHMPEEKVSLGLDLQGGTHLVLQVDLTQKNEGITDNDAVNLVRSILERRVNAIGLTEPIIQRQGKDRIIVELAGVKNPQQAKDMVGKTAKLEFKLVNPDVKAYDSSTYTEDTEILSFVRKNKSGSSTKSKIAIFKNVHLSGSEITNAKVGYNMEQNNEPYVSIEFSPEGTEKFAEVTGNNVGGSLAIVLDGIVYSAPRINEPIETGNAQISGGFTVVEARDLAVVLRSGALPAPVNIIEDRTVGASLGDENIKMGMYAVILGFALVIVFMLIYYQTVGVTAIPGLFFNLLVCSINTASV